MSATKPVIFFEKFSGINSFITNTKSVKEKKCFAFYTLEMSGLFIFSPSFNPFPSLPSCTIDKNTNILSTKLSACFTLQLFQTILTVLEFQSNGTTLLLEEHNREFKKLRRQLQRKRHIYIELCVKSFAIIPC